MRVYPINEEQYEHLQKLTNGKNVISEARLTSAGFTSVRDSIDSGWNSLLRIIGLTSTTRSDDTKIDIDGQPLCVMRRSLSDAQPRGKAGEQEATKTAGEQDDDSVINCIVVLKDDPALAAQSAVLSNPNFAPYWYTEQPEVVAETVEQQTLPERASAAEPEPASVSAAQPVPAVTKSKRKNKLQQKRRKTTLRQYPAGYPQLPLPPLPPPPPPAAGYGAGYGSPYGYGGEAYGQTPYNPYGSYPAAAYPTSPYPATPYPSSPYPASPYPASPYPPSPYTPGAYAPSAYPAPSPYGSPAPYGQYPYYDKIREGAELYEADDDDDDGFEVYEADGDDSYESEYYD